MGVKGVFERLDQSYLDDLVVKTRQGSSNAFAELFASVSDRQLYYLCRLFGSREEAVSALREVFTITLKNIHGLARADLFMPWLCRHSVNVHLERTGKERASNSKYTLSQLLNLPLAESQIMFMYAEQGLTVREIGDILNVGTGTVRRFIRLGEKHLTRAQNTPDSAGTGEHHGHFALGLYNEETRLTPVEAAEILEAAYDACAMEHNNIPMEALSSYAVYRKERFSLQRSILTIALVIFMLLPALFFIPGVIVEADEEGERGLPVYTVEIKSLLPVGKVIASIRNHNLPVYEVSGKEYTVEPTRNGSMSISVELVNHQRVTGEYDVTSVDAEGPKLTDNETMEDTFLIRVQDAGIGVDYREVYAVGSSGRTFYPIFANEEEGIMFEYPDEDWDIYIPDHIGNTLHLAVNLH